MTVLELVKELLTIKDLNRQVYILENGENDDVSKIAYTCDSQGKNNDEVYIVKRDY